MSAETADSIRLTADGVVPLDVTCPSSREALLVQPTLAAVSWWRRTARSRGTGVWGRRWWPKTAACLHAAFGQPSSIRPELTGIALALEDCPGEEDLNILTDSLSSMESRSMNLQTRWLQQQPSLIQHAL